jgi:hypothetical protein
MAENNAAAKKQPPKETGYIGETSPERGHVPITEEFDRAKWTMPPLKPLLVAMALVAVVVAGILFFGRPKPGASATIDDIFAVETPDQSSVLVAVQFTIRNISEKPFWVRAVSAHLETDQGKWDDPAASIADFDRYFQAFPELKQHATAKPWVKDTKINVGEEQRGMVIVSFPVPKDAFERRKSFSVTVDAFDRRPLVITK